VKELSALDLRHFGWNIWNYFKKAEKSDGHCELVEIVPDIFRGVDVVSIKRHLKDDELKGIIKIKEIFYE